LIAEAPSVSSERFTVMPSTTKAGQHQPLVANRQPLQPGWLAERYVADMMSADEIAEKCGWSSQYVRDRLRDFGIPLRRPGTLPFATDPGPETAGIVPAARTIGDTDQPANRVQHLWGSQPHPPAGIDHPSHCRGTG